VSRARNGGLPARRAVVRWAWRVFRRDWRQQVLVLALLTFTVAGALLGIAVVYNATPSQDARFGSAEQFIRYDAEDPEELDANVTAARAWFGTIDVIGYRHVTVQGLVRGVEMRAQDPNGPYSGPMLRLLAGRYPTGAGEVAVTDEIAALTRVSVGGQLALGDRTQTVVGIIESPNDLGAEFILVSPAHADPPESVTILVAADQARFDRFVAGAAVVSINNVRGRNERTLAAVGAFALAALAMLLVCFVAVAGFIAMAQRRMRQFGLLAATGATERHVRLVLLAAGASAGFFAAALGAVVFIPLWIVVRPRLEVSSAHRIDPVDLPWWLIGASLVLAVVTATGAAWWPAWVAARIPVTQALSMRPPRPRPAHRSAIAAVLLLAAGVGCLRLAHQNNVPLIIAGTVATIVGLPFLSPLAIRLLSAAGSRLPVAARLALRDLARHQARSGAALAAISLALAIPAVVVISLASDAEAHERRGEHGNLSDRQLMIQTDTPGEQIFPDRTPAQSAAIEAGVIQLAASLGTPTVIPLDVAIDPKTPRAAPFEGGASGQRAVWLAVYSRSSGPDGVHISMDLPQGMSGRLYIATPAILRYYRLDPIGPGIDALTVGPPGDWVFGYTGEPDGPGSEPTRAAIASMPRSRYSSLPDSLLSQATVQSHGWQTVRAAWLIENDRPLTEAQLAAARDLAVGLGLTVDFRDPGASQLRVRVMATTGGGVLALGILAMTIGLIRGEGARDMHTLAATGATRWIRRTLTAATASGLALLGAILGVTVVYLALIAAYDKDVGLLSRVPFVDLVVTVLGVPLVAGVAGWLLAGREPTSLSRIRLD
jgi:putative ABC transport system permease protein